MSCNQFNEASDAPKVTGLNLTLDLNSQIEEPITFGDEMVVKLENYNEGLHYEQTFSGSSCTVSNIVPGIYTINISGIGYSNSGEKYILSGNASSKTLLSDSRLDIDLKGALKGDFVFSEIYYCGSKPTNAFAYFRDQFYEIANNTTEVQYLDGLHFANTGVISFSKERPVWPTEDGDNYIYASRVWKFPGNGTDYPLQPGESCVVAQFAANHQLEIYNPTSPVDCSSAEFEFNMNNVNYPDQPAVDMIHVYYDGQATMTGVQYLTSVFGTGYIIFRIPDGETWDPVNDTSLQAYDASDSWSDLYAKVPVRYVVDAVEGIRNSSYADAKNIPAVLDAGFVTVGGTYLSQSVVRKVETLNGANGAILYEDTNNSSDDFECGLTPKLHRYSKMPSWNHTLQ
jgi:hypothetical protein